MSTENLNQGNPREEQDQKTPTAQPLTEQNTGRETDDEEEEDETEYDLGDGSDGGSDADGGE